MSPRIDFRLYRLAFAPMLLALIVLMFSLDGAPRASEPATAPAAFEGDRAALLAEQIARLAPERPAGSAGDGAVAELVARRFGEVAAGAVSEQTYEAESDGEQVSLRNVVLTLPGDPERTVVVLAARDWPRGPGAASSAAATGILVELANTLGVAGHEKTLVFASTSGAVAGAAGARELLAQLPEAETVEAVIVISQPGIAEPSPPFVVNSSTGATSGPVGLERTAELAVENQAERDSTEASAFTQLARLAIPSGLGEQAPLIDAGFAAIAVSSAGERPLASDAETELSPESVDAFGRAVQATVDAVDSTPTPLDRGPGAHLELDDNLVAGWTLGLIALTLILPAAVVALDACVRVARRGSGLGAGLAWAGARSLPFCGALLALYGLAAVGAVPGPPFPFDPAEYELGTRGVVAFVAITLTAIGTAVLLRLRAVRADRAPTATLAGLGAISAAAAAVIWLANPYLALLCAPAANVWLLAGREPGIRTAALALALAAIAALPVIAALIAISDALGLGGDGPWTFTLMIAGGQIGLATSVAACFLIGAVTGALALCIRRPRPLPAGG